MVDDWAGEWSGLWYIIQRVHDLGKTFNIWWSIESWIIPCPRTFHYTRAVDRNKTVYWMKSYRNLGITKSFRLHSDRRSGFHNHLKIILNHLKCSLCCVLLKRGFHWQGTVETLGSREQCAALLGNTTSPETFLKYFKYFLSYFLPFCLLPAWSRKRNAS